MDPQLHPNRPYVVPSWGKHCGSRNSTPETVINRKESNELEPPIEASSNLKEQEVDRLSVEDLLDEEEEEGDDSRCDDMVTQFWCLKKAVLCDQKKLEEELDLRTTCIKLNSNEEFQAAITTNAKVVYLFYCIVVDKVWFSNVPHASLVEYKGGQNWITISKNKFNFPGGGTQFIHGADQYLDQISKMIVEIAFGRRTRVVLDVGCGVASFGAYLLSRNVPTMSMAPKDVHENKVQFALECGVPAM